VAEPKLTTTRRGVALGACASVALVLVPFVGVIVGSRSAMWSDVNNLTVPLYRAVWSAIWSGHWPFWSSLEFSGHNMVGAAQSAIFYPPNIVFGWLSPMAAFRCWLVFHLALAAVGSYLWSWRQWRSLPAAVVSGVAYPLSGFMILHLLHQPLVAMAAWLPWLFLGVDLVAERWSLTRSGLAAGSVAMIAFTGHPQGLWQALVGVGLVCVVRLSRRRVGLGPWWRAGAAVGLGLGVGAIQILPLRSFSTTSVRPKLTQAGAFQYASSGRQLLTVLIPHVMGGGSGLGAASWRGGSIYHEVANYLGITLVVLALVALVTHWRQRQVVAMGVLSAFALLTALGPHTFVGPLVYDVVPLARSFRAWGRNLVLADLAVANLAGLGVREVLARPRRYRMPLTAAAAIGAVVAATLPWWTDLGGRLVRGQARAVALWTPVVWLVLLAVAIWVATVHRRLGAVVIVAVCALDMMSFAYSSPWRTSGKSTAAIEAFYGPSPPLFGWPYRAPGGVDRWVAVQPGRDPSPTGPITDLLAPEFTKGAPSAGGYDPLIQATYAHLAGGMNSGGSPSRADFASPGWLADVLRVTTMLLPPAQRPTDPAWTDTGYIDALHLERWVRTPRLAEAYLVGRVLAAPLGAMTSVLHSPWTDLSTTAYVDTRAPGAAGVPTGRDQAGPAGAVVSGAMSSDGDGHYVIDATRAGLLVLSYGWEPGWQASVDGHLVSVVRTDGLVLGIAVGPGAHRVHVWFTPPGLATGALVSTLSVLTVLAGGSLPWWRRRRSRATLLASTRCPCPGRDDAHASPSASASPGS